jgi:hypothetical protein
MGGQSNRHLNRKSRKNSMFTFEYYDIRQASSNGTLSFPSSPTFHKLCIYQIKHASGDRAKAQREWKNHFVFCPHPPSFTALIPQHAVHVPTYCFYPLIVHNFMFVSGQRYAKARNGWHRFRLYPFQRYFLSTRT